MARRKKTEEVRRAPTDAEALDHSGYKYPEMVPLPPSSRVFKVGDPVIIGNLKDAVVCEVLHSGRFLRINYTDVKNNYGNPIETPDTKGIWGWFDVVHDEGNGSSRFSAGRLRLHWRTQTLDSLLMAAYRFGWSALDLNPDYQRGLVWSDEDREKLLDSLFRGLDIGRFVLRSLPYKEGFTFGDEIVDGKQRLSTLIDFWTDRFTYKGFLFSELSRQDRGEFMRHIVNVAELPEETTDEEVLKIFLAVNDTGKPVAKEHLEKIRERLKR
jgi:hypothetical protein